MISLHPIDKNLRPSARWPPETGRLQSLEHRHERQLVDLREVMNFRRAEAMHVDLRKMPLDVSQQLLVPVELEVRVQAALHKNLIPAKLDGFANFLKQHIAVEHITFVMLRLAVNAQKSQTAVQTFV